MIGVTTPYLSDIEKGRRAATDGDLEEIPTALKLSASKCLTSQYVVDNDS